MQAWLENKWCDFKKIRFDLQTRERKRLGQRAKKQKTCLHSWQRQAALAVHSASNVMLCMKDEKKKKGDQRIKIKVKDWTYEGKCAGRAFWIEVQPRRQTRNVWVAITRAFSRSCSCCFSRVQLILIYQKKRVSLCVHTQNTKSSNGARTKKKSNQIKIKFKLKSIEIKIKCLKWKKSKNIPKVAFQNWNF